MKKNYAQIGGNVGCALCLLFIIIGYSFDHGHNEASGIFLGLTIGFGLLAILIGYFFGWLYGKIKNRNKVIE